MKDEKENEPYNNTGIHPTVSASESSNKTKMAKEKQAEQQKRRHAPLPLDKKQTSENS